MPQGFPDLDLDHDGKEDKKSWYAQLSGSDEGLAGQCRVRAGEVGR